MFVLGWVGLFHWVLSTVTGWLLGSHYWRAELVPIRLLCTVAFIANSVAMQLTQGTIYVLNGSTVQRGRMGLSWENDRLFMWSGFGLNIWIMVCWSLVPKFILLERVVTWKVKGGQGSMDLGSTNCSWEPRLRSLKAVTGEKQEGFRCLGHPAFHTRSSRSQRPF